MAVSIVRILTITFLIIKGASSMYESSYHYLLMSNHLSLQKKIMAVLKPLGLSTGQPKVLDHLRYHNGASQKDIAHACHIELFSGISNAEKEQFLKIFEKLYKNTTKEE